MDIPYVANRKAYTGSTVHTVIMCSLSTSVLKRIFGGRCLGACGCGATCRLGKTLGFRLKSYCRNS